MSNLTQKFGLFSLVTATIVLVASACTIVIAEYLE